MMRKFLSWPIRVHLLLLVILLVLPSITLILYSGVVARDQAIEDAESECLKFVNAIAGEQQAAVAGAQQLVAALAMLPMVQSRNGPVTDALLSDLLKKNPLYSNIVISDQSGFIWASSTPLEGNISIAGRKYFQDAVRSGTFSSGEFSVGRIAKKPVMTFAQPAVNTSNELGNVIAVAMNLDYFQSLFDKINLPAGSSFSLLDHRGIILHRNSRDALSEQLVGKPDIREELFTKMVEGADEGTYEAIGNDGKDRLTAYKKIRLPHHSQPYLYIRSSVLKASVVSRANAAMFMNMVILTSVFAVGLILALFIGKRMILDPVTKLKEASRQLTAGSGLVNVSEHVKDGELGELALAFDDMAEELLRREEETHGLLATVQAEKDRLSALINSMNDEVWFTDMEKRFSLANPSGLREFGLGTNNGIDVEKLAASLEVFRPDGTPRPVEEAPPLRALKGEIVRNQEEIVRTPASNELRYREVNAAPVRDAQGSIIGSISVVRDITDRKRADDDLRKSEEALRLANDSLEQRVRERTMDLQNLAEQLERSRGELRKLASELVMAEERERKRIAGVLHDEIAQTLAAVRMRLELLQGIPSDQKDTQTLEEAKVLVMQSLQETRALMNDLGNPLLFDMGLKPACEAFANRLMERHPVRISCDIRDAYKHLDPDVKAILYQVVRELLNNVVKHSRAQNAHVLIDMENGHFRARVTDDGVGFDPRMLGAPTVEGGFGLYSIRERLIAVGGSLRIESAAGTGTVVTAIVPETLD
jgi:PAS domain S-box-containing protein